MVDQQLRLRPIRPDDEDVVRAAHRAMAADDFEFATDLNGRNWADYLQRLAGIDAGTDLPADRVPGSLLLAEVDGTVVGRTSLRYRLNDWLLARGGHVGYGVLAEHRGRGYATEILRCSLVLLRARGVGDVLVTCDDTNAASRMIIERCGGVLDPQQPFAEHDGVAVRRYWIRG